MKYKSSIWFCLALRILKSTYSPNIVIIIDHHHHRHHHHHHDYHQRRQQPIQGSFLSLCSQFGGFGHWLQLLPWCRLWLQCLAAATDGTFSWAALVLWSSIHSNLGIGFGRRILVVKWSRVADSFNIDIVGCVLWLQLVIRVWMHTPTYMCRWSQGFVVILHTIVWKDKNYGFSSVVWWGSAMYQFIPSWCKCPVFSEMFWRWKMLAQYGELNLRLAWFGGRFSD